MSRLTRWIQVAAAGAALLAGSELLAAQTPASASDAPPQQAAPAAAIANGGTIHGSVKAGPVPLPGVSVTATSSVTGKKFATTTDVDGNYSMTVPKDGAYVVKAELAAFAAVTHEVQMTAVAGDQTTEFALQLASRVPATPAAGAPATAATSAAGTTGTRTPGQRPTGAGGAGGGYGGGRTRTQQGRGTQTLGDGEAADANTLDATTGGGDAATPSLGGMADAATESIAVSGIQGSTNGLANLSEDQLNRQIQGAQDNIRNQGGNPQDQMNGVVSLLSGIQNGGAGLFGVGGGPGGGAGGPGGPGGGGGGRGGPGGGGRGGAGGGGGAFRNFNPAQPHGSIFYQGGNSALNSAPWQPSLVSEVNPSAYQNRFGLSITGTPYIPGVTKPDTRQFAFINLTGQKNLNAFAPNPVRVPTALERMGDFSQSLQEVSGAAVPVTLYDPKSGLAIPGNNLANASVPISQQAINLLNYYPLCNINCVAAQTNPKLYNYQTISNAGSNNVAINARYQRQLGQQTNNQFGRGGARGGGGGGGQRGQRPNQNLPPVLRQNINVQYNYSHSASDIRNVFLPLGGATESNGYSLNLGYVVSYGRISNNASLSWNRSNSETRNYFTNTPNNPTSTAGLNIPNQANNFADPKFYNGVPSLGITNFASLGNTTPSDTIGQTISFSDFVAWRHKKHNFRFGGDIRRVHSDSIGGNTPLGSYSFTGYATSNPSDQVAGNGGINSGSGFADFLLGLPQSTSIQAGTYKDYLRENVYDWYATDDWRLLSNVTLNYGLRYEYFGPYSEKFNHLVNLTGVTSITSTSVPVGCTTPTGTSYSTPAGTVTCPSAGSSSLVNPDYAMYAPRFGFAYSPKFKHTKNVVIRGGYGINYNTGQYATFARLLSHQAPFSVTQNNSAYAPTVASPTPTPSGCMTTQAATTFMDSTGATHTRAATTSNMSLGSAAAGFNCSTLYTINNNWAVDKNYKLGMVQIYNLNIQKVVGALYVLNLGYNGAKGSNLDNVGTPDATPASVFPGTIAAFDYERSLASSRTNSLVFGVVRRQHKGIALSATYTYLHAIDNASGVGGAVGTPVQNYYNLKAEEGNSSFDQRHNVTGTFLGELPFGPNREFFNKGGAMAKILDGFSVSGTFTFGTGNYFTPTYSNSASESAAANTLRLRPDRVPTQSLKGPGKVTEFFNPAAFTKPGCAAYAVAGTPCPASASSGAYGTASQGSIEGPGTVSVSAALSRTVQLGGTNSFEARVQATNVFNTVQYSGINTTENSASFGQVTSAAAMRALVVIARYRF